MDPLTQGSLGAALPQSAARREQIGLATVAGFAAGMAPDLDVLIRSSEDPLLFLEYHRQFTHSLIFIPVGAALVALALWLFPSVRRRGSFRQVYGFCALGYGTHALLDACTTYGTQLLWPFSDARFAWNNVSIIDPLLTVPLLALVITARRKRWPWAARLAMVWVVGYLFLGVLARDAARDEGLRLAQSRGHEPALLEAKPSFANLLLWKIVYRYDDSFYVDAVRLGSSPVIYPGSTVPALDLKRDFPWLDPASRQARDVERFSWFSKDYVAVDPENPRRIMDIRFSMLPNEIRPLWVLELDPETQHTVHGQYLTERRLDDSTWTRFGLMLRGEPLPRGSLSAGGSVAPVAVESAP